MRWHATRPRDLDEPLRVRAVRGPENEQQLDVREQLLDGLLPVRRRVTDVFLLRAVEGREAAEENGDDLARLVDGQRRLCDVGHSLRILDLELLGVGHRLDEDDRIRGLAHRSLDLLVARVPDEDDRVARGGVSLRLRVHLRHEWTGSVDRSQRSRVSAGANGGGEAPRREEDQAALRDLLDAADEDCATPAKLVDDVRVVHDLFSDVNGRPVLRKRALDGLHRSLDACAISTRRREQDPLDHAANVAAPLGNTSRLNRNINRPSGYYARPTKPPQASLATPDRKKAGRPGRRCR